MLVLSGRGLLTKYKVIDGVQNTLLKFPLK